MLSDSVTINGIGFFGSMAMALNILSIILNIGGKIKNGFDFWSTENLMEYYIIGCTGVSCVCMLIVTIISCKIMERIEKIDSSPDMYTPLLHAYKIDNLM